MKAVTTTAALAVLFGILVITKPCICNAQVGTVVPPPEASPLEPAVPYRRHLVFAGYGVGTDARLWMAGYQFQVGGYDGNVRLAMDLDVTQIGDGRQTADEAQRLHRPEGYDLGYSMGIIFFPIHAVGGYAEIGLHGRVYTPPGQRNVTPVENYSSSLGLGVDLDPFELLSIRVAGRYYISYIFDEDWSKRQQDAFKNAAVVFCALSIRL